MLGVWTFQDLQISGWIIFKNSCLEKRYFDKVFRGFDISMPQLKHSILNGMTKNYVNKRLWYTFSFYFFALDPMISWEFKNP